MPSSPLPDLAPPPTLAQYAAVVARIGLTSFGGGVSGWMLRVVVQQKRWMTEAEFLTGLSLSQAFPGINVLNIAIWLGYRLHGGLGALVGGLVMTVPPGLVLLALAAVLTDASRWPLVQAALDGVAAAAIGLGASMGVRAARRAAGGAVPVGIMVTAFTAIGVLRLPLVPVVAVLAPVSIALAWMAGRHAG